MDPSRVLTVPGNPEGIRLAAEALDAFAEAHGLSRHATWPFQVALDELVSNVARHGRREDGREVTIEMELRLRGDELEIELVDDGPPFDPLEAPEPDTSLPVEERPIGGLGILILKRLMDAVAYERRADRNRLTLRKRLVAPEGTE